MSGREHKKRRLRKNDEIQSLSKIKDKSFENLVDITFPTFFFHFMPYERPLLKSGCVSS